VEQKRATGKMSLLAGMAAEDAVAADYARRGHPVAARRWRGSRGELDIVARNGDGLIVVDHKLKRNFMRNEQLDINLSRFNKLNKRLHVSVFCPTHKCIRIIFSFPFI